MDSPREIPQNVPDLNSRMLVVENRIEDTNTTIVAQLSQHIKFISLIATFFAVVMTVTSLVSRADIKDFMDVQLKRINDVLGQAAEKPILEAYVDKYLKKLDGAEVQSTLEKNKGNPDELLCFAYFTLKNTSEIKTDDISMVWYSTPPLSNTSASADESEYENQGYVIFRKLSPGMPANVPLSFIFNKKLLTNQNNKSDVKIKIYYGGKNLLVQKFKVIVDFKKAKELFEKPNNATQENKPTPAQ